MLRGLFFGLGEHPMPVDSIAVMTDSPLPDGKEVTRAAAYSV